MSRDSGISGDERSRWGYYKNGHGWPGENLNIRASQQRLLKRSIQVSLADSVNINDHLEVTNFQLIINALARSGRYYLFHVQEKPESCDLDYCKAEIHRNFL